MASKNLDVESLLRAAFLKAELDFLKSHGSFADACDSAKTATDFERLCELAEELLKSHGSTNPAAHQFRRSIRRTEAHSG